MNEDAYIPIYIYLEPKWPLFLKVNPPTRVIWVLGTYRFMDINILLKTIPRRFFKTHCQPSDAFSNNPSIGYLRYSPAERLVRKPVDKRLGNRLSYNFPICSKYGIFTYIYYEFKPNVGVNMLCMEHLGLIQTTSKSNEMCQQFWFWLPHYWMGNVLIPRTSFSGWVEYMKTNDFQVLKVAWICLFDAWKKCLKKNSQMVVSWSWQPLGKTLLKVKLLVSLVGFYIWGNKAITWDVPSIPWDRIRHQNHLKNSSPDGHFWTAIDSFFGGWTSPRITSNHSPRSNGNLAWERKNPVLRPFDDPCR